MTDEEIAHYPVDAPRLRHTRPFESTTQAHEASIWRCGDWFYRAIAFPVNHPWPDGAMIDFARARTLDTVGSALTTDVELDDASEDPDWSWRQSFSTNEELTAAFARWRRDPWSFLVLNVL